LLYIFRTCKQELKKSEILLKALKVTGIAGQKQAVSVLKSVETRHKQLATLKARSDALQLKHTNMAGLVTEENSYVSTHDPGRKN
jgi:hypothetical protein